MPRTCRLSLILPLLMSLLLIGVRSHANLADVRVRSDDAATTFEVMFNAAVKLHPQLIEGKVSAFELALDAVGDTANPGWMASELTFAEPAHVLQRVTLEGDRTTQLHLKVELRQSAYVTVLPQYIDQHVMFVVRTKEQPRSNKPEASLTSRIRQLVTRSPDTAPGMVYVLTLEDRLKRAPTLQDVPAVLAQQHTIYLAPYRADGAAWQHLRAGFFESRKAAIAARAKVLARFPDARIEQVSASEIDFASAFQLNSAAADRPDNSADAAASVHLGVQAVTPSTMDTLGRRRRPEPTQWVERDDGEDPLLKQADDAFRAKDYDAAIRLYERLSTNAAEPSRQLALERLGISRELNGQVAHARRVYGDYLAQYPATPGAGRIKLRMDALTALATQAPPALRRVERESAWHTTANLSQHYRRHALVVEGRERVPIDGLLTDVGVNVRRQGEQLQHEARLTLSHLWDFTGELEGRDFQVGRAYWDSYVVPMATGFRVGRQTKFDAGVLGRFDGLTVTHTPSDAVEVGLVAGYAVRSVFEAPDTQRPLYGVYGSVDALGGALRISPFVIQQKFQGVVDRQALGIRSRFSRDRLHLSALLDYDFHHEALNNLSVAASFARGDSAFDLSLEQRRSPYVATHNALIGQPFDELSDLERALIDLSLQEVAENRSATTRAARLAWNQRLSNRFSVSADILVTDISSTQSVMDSAGVDARRDYFSSMQIRALDVYGKSSYSGLILRQIDSETSTTHSVFWDNRFALGRQWMLQPRLRYDYRTYDAGDQVQTTTKPSFRLSYRWHRGIRFEFEAGYETTTREVQGDDYDISGFFINAGYRAVF